jgi:lipid-A-disaccharide synthase
MKFLISAGEASSDLYGAQLIVALRRRARANDEPLEFMGVGGEKMRAAGCKTVVDSRHLAVFGITEIVSHLPNIYAQFRKLVAAMDSAALKPAAAIVIDSPAFNFRVAREMHARGIPVIYFVAPQLWAWRQYRVKRVQKWVRKVLCIFPFEVDFYRDHGVDVEYVGHPLADLAPPAITREEYAKTFALRAEAQWIALLPGSRKKEVRAHLPIMLAAASKIGGAAKFDFLVPVAANLDPEWIKALIANSRDQWQVPLGNSLRFLPVDDARAALLHSRAALVASGTATVEAALVGTPFLVVYRLSPLTFYAAKRLVTVPFAAMPNLIAGRQIVPELLQDNLTAENAAKALAAIITDGSERQAMIAALTEVSEKLQFREAGARGDSAVERAADAILRALPASEER